MSVDPLKSNAMPHADTGRGGSSSGARCPDAHPTAESRLEQPAPEAGDRVPEGAMSPERMREVLRRLELGHYNSAEVQEKVAHAVRQELGLDQITSATSGSA